MKASAMSKDPNEQWEARCCLLSVLANMNESKRDSESLTIVATDEGCKQSCLSCQDHVNITVWYWWASLWWRVAELVVMKS